MGYRGKVVEQDRARTLRAAGWTYGEIAAELGVSRSSVSLWVRDVEVDEDAWLVRSRRNRNHGARNRRPNRLQLAKAAEIEAGRAWGAATIGRLSDRDLLVAGAALYAGEGTKGGVEARFSNSDPRMVVLYMAWLRRCLGIDESKLRVRLYLHQGLDLDAANAFWSQITGIPLDQFRTPYRAVPDPSIRRTKHEHGCVCVILIGSTVHRRVLGLVEALLHSPVPSPG